MNSELRKRSVVLAGRKTSISIEDAFWDGVREMSAARNVPINDLITGIDRARAGGNLSSNIRVAVLRHFHDRVVVGAMQ